MIFPSYIFLFVFLPAVLLVWHSQLPFRLRLVLLTVASYVFYGWWDYRFTLLMLVSTVIDYRCGLGIHQSATPRSRKRYLIASLVSNLALLGFFKYFDFFAGSVTSLMETLHLAAHVPLLDIVLPIGISFYTFQSMSYSIDIYRRDARPAPDFLHFAAYVSLFPQLVAGPIVRYAHMESQLYELAERRQPKREYVFGAYYFIAGLGKKLLIADAVATPANLVFNGGVPVQFASAWIGSLCYTIQLYFDFSGYSDMAIGLGLLFGFRFPINFNSPYQAKSISEFWNRWHISLSHFLRDYLYIPLGGSRGGVQKTIRNLFITMFLGGLWHGAQWTFVVWGLYHGLLLACNTAWHKLTNVRLPKLLGLAATFFAVHLGWVVFRASDFERAAEIYQGMFGLLGVESFLTATNTTQNASLANFVQSLGGIQRFVVLAIGLFTCLCLPNTHELRCWQSKRGMVVLAAIFVACLFSMSRTTPFLYFQF